MISRSRRRTAFTLVEILIVVVILSILAAAIVPQFNDATADAKKSTTLYNLQVMRSQLELYRAHHNGTPPTTLDKMTQITDASGATGTGPTFIYGPYMRKIPKNAMNNFETVTATSSTAPTADDATGWFFNNTTGGIWINTTGMTTE